MAVRTLIRHFQYLWSSFMVRFQLMLDCAVQTAGPMYIVLAFGLISAVIYLFFTVILPSVHNIFSWQGVLHILISSWLIFNVFFNYLWCIYTDPGAAPTGSDPGADLSKYESATSQYRWCKRCRRPKPPMTHHCHICKRCILKMDHHCPWMHNCIGFYNYRYFFLFLVYMWAGCVYTTLMASIPLFRSSVFIWGMYKDSEEFSYLEPGSFNAILFAFVLALAVLVSMSFLLGWHIYLVLTAQTTIDFYANRQRRREGRRIGQVWENEFDMGALQNFRNTFDLNDRSWWLVFLFPSRRALKGDGMHFPTKQDRPDVENLSNGSTQLHHIQPNHSTMGSVSRPSTSLQRVLADESMRESEMV
ncbi:unnamed protein product [Calypogeia fissa]